MSATPIPDSPRAVGAVLKQLFEGHNIAAILNSSGRITFPHHPYVWCEGALFQMYEQIVQLDFRLSGFGGDRTLVESVVGTGVDAETLARSALQAFNDGTFHVLLPAFFGVPECHGTEREFITISGQQRELFLGPCTSRFGFPMKPDGTTIDLDFFDACMTALKNQEIPPGTHWIRLYHMRHRGQMMGNEVLLDNEAWPAMQEVMAAYQWPILEKIYNVRLFLIIKDKAEERPPRSAPKTPRHR